MCMWSWNVHPSVCCTTWSSSSLSPTQCSASQTSPRRTSATRCCARLLVPLPHPVDGSLHGGAGLQVPLDLLWSHVPRLDVASQRFYCYETFKMQHLFLFSPPPPDHRRMDPLEMPDLPFWSIFLQISSHCQMLEPWPWI